MDTHDLLTDAAALLADARTASLATADDAGHPHAANIQHAPLDTDPLTLCWVSSPRSAHSRHLADRPAVALTVYGQPDVSPDQLHGLQLHGTASATDDDRVLKAYRERFPFTADEPWASAIRQQQHYLFTPTWVRMIDNRRGFGWSRELRRTGDRWTAQA
jgi:uncharacterized protein YhbP (UPF0306 family)